MGDTIRSVWEAITSSAVRNVDGYTKSVEKNSTAQKTNSGLVSKAKTEIGAQISAVVSIGAAYSFATEFIAEFNNQSRQASQLALEAARSAEKAGIFVSGLAESQRLAAQATLTTAIALGSTQREINEQILQAGLQRQGIGGRALAALRRVTGAQAIEDILGIDRTEALGTQNLGGESRARLARSITPEAIGQLSPKDFEALIQRLAKTGDSLDNLNSNISASSASGTAASP